MQTTPLLIPMTTNYQLIEDTNGVEHIVIDRGNDEFTSMPKSVWDELQAAKEAQSL